jgi:hypothetical protein
MPWLEAVFCRELQRLQNRASFILLVMILDEAES